MGRGEFVRRRQDVLGNGIENAGILAEKAYVEDFLGVTEAEMLESGIETGLLRAKVRNAETGRNLKWSDGGLQQIGGNPTPAPVRTTMFFDLLRRSTASSKVLYCRNFTRLESSRDMQASNKR